MEQHARPRLASWGCSRGCRVQVSGSKAQGAAGLMVLLLLLFQKTKRQSHTEEAIE